MKKNNKTKAAQMQRKSNSNPIARLEEISEMAERSYRLGGISKEQYDDVKKKINDIVVNSVLRAVANMDIDDIRLALAEQPK